MKKKEDKPEKVLALEAQAREENAAVDRFAEAMKIRLAEKRENGFSGGFDVKKCSQAELSKRLYLAARRGKTVDVANFALMLWSREEPVIFKDE